MAGSAVPGEGGQWDVVSSVGLTALAAAAARALETHRDDAWISDPYAEALVRAADPPRPIPARPDELEAVEDAEWWRTTSLYLATRTRYVDEYFSAAIAAGLRQVVLLGAGLDTRAQRLVWPTGTGLFEIDQPEVLEFKRSVLADLGARAGCAHREVGIDLRGDWVAALRGAGFDPAAPTAWLAEGLVSYLGADGQDRLLAAVADCSAEGSWIEIPSPIPGAERAVVQVPGRFSDTIGANVETMISAERRPSPATWFRDRGWRVEVEAVADVATAWGRPPGARESQLAFPAIEFITARR